jgi:hypothetical protein
MRDLSVMEIEMVSGAGWWADLWTSTSETISGWGSAIRTAFESWGTGTPTITQPAYNLLQQCIAAGNNAGYQAQQGGFSLSFNTNGGVVQLTKTGGTTALTCNGVAIQ